MGKRLLRSVPDWVIGAAALVVFASLLFGLFELRTQYASPDAIDGFVVVGADVLLTDRLHSGDGETSLPGGARLLLLDGASGMVKTRKRVGAGHRLVTVVAGVAWLRVHGRSFEAFDVQTLSVHATPDDLVHKTPELRAIADRSEGCYDGKGAWRFTTTDGRFVAFRFADGTLAPVATTSCPRIATETRNGRLADGRAVGLREIPSSARAQLVIGDGGKPAPVGELSYLDGRLLLDPRSDPQRLLCPSSNDVLITRRTGTNDTSGTEIARVSLEGKIERWSTRLADKAAHIEQVEAHEGRLLLRFAKRLTVLDLETGAVRWQYGE